VKLANLLHAITCCFSPDLEEPSKAPKGTAPASGAPPEALADKTVQSASPGLPRAPFMQRCLKRLQSITAALSCGLRRSNPEALDGLATQHREEAEAQAKQGKLGAALKNYRQAVKIGTRLMSTANAATNPQEHTRCGYLLADSHARVGHLQRLMEQPWDALKSYWQAIQIGNEILSKVTDHAERLRCQQLLLCCHAALGKLHMQVDRPLDALTSHQAELHISQQIAELHGNEACYQRNVIAALEHLSEVQTAMGSLPEALVNAQTALALRGRDLIEADSQALPGMLYRLVLGHNAVGDLQKDLRQPQAALASYQKALAFLNELAAQPRDDDDDVSSMLDSLGTKISDLQGNMA
jgi:tetratricopeptide (TPR) repeat protein